jgi:hypothetical protein
VRLAALSRGIRLDQLLRPRCDSTCMWHGRGNNALFGIVLAAVHAPILLASRIIVRCHPSSTFTVTDRDIKTLPLSCATASDGRALPKTLACLFLMLCMCWLFLRCILVMRDVCGARKRAARRRGPLARNRKGGPRPPALALALKLYVHAQLYSVRAGALTAFSESIGHIEYFLNFEY